MARLTGAALNSRVVKEIRGELANDYGLPMDKYLTDEVDSYSLGSDMQPILEVVFKHAGTGAAIKVTDIYPDDNGHLETYGSNYGYLTY